MTDEAKMKLSGGVARRKTSKWWYGRYKVDGKEYFKNLRVGVRGTPPKSDEEHGSVQYEKSRTEAEILLRGLLKEIETGKPAEELAQAVHEARTGGRRVVVHDLADLPDLWKQIPRTKAPTTQHAKQCISTINSFLNYCAEHFPELSKLDHLSEEQARQYMNWQEARGISPKTWNDILSVLRAACKRGKSTAFDDFKCREKATVHRIPYTPDELKEVFEAAKSDPFIYPIIVTAACTAMRRGDCCLLMWEAVDLKEGFITVKTSKTKRTVDIPIAGMLYDVISEQVGNGSKYVFSKQAIQYKKNPDMLTDRLRTVLAKAGFRDDNKKGVRHIDNFDVADLKAKVEAHIKTIPTVKKRERMSHLFDLYMTGIRMCEAAESIGISKASASGYLNELENATGIAFIRGKQRTDAKLLPPKRGSVHVEREFGLKKASVRDFHSFRTTWITIALCSGIPFELVKKVTGHATAEIVMEHYFKPQRSQLKEAIQSSMPNLLTAGKLSLADRAAETLGTLNGNNWKQVKAEVLQMLGQEAAV